MEKIKITGEVFPEGYGGAFLREIDADGKELATGIWDKWYKANACDADGKPVKVCSDECRQKREKQWQQKADAKRNPRNKRDASK